MPQTSNRVTITQAVVDLLTTNKGALGVLDVWYGDEQLIPRVPAISVDGAPKTKEWYGTGNQTRNEFVLQITIYHGQLASMQVTQKACEELAEAVEDVLESDIRLGGLLTDSLVTASEPGFSRRGSVTMKATRLTWRGRSSTRLGS